MIKDITVRFFCHIDVEDGGGDFYIDIIETDETTFLRLGGEITYERHTMFANGCNQVCLTTDAYLEE
jgi:hypothetical protein